MQIVIDERVKNSATKCRWDYACLSNNNDNNHKICKIERGNGILFIKYREEILECHYRISFGFSSYICSCPVRKDIYKQYEC